jgi:protein-S-isoprenylcysteine O-methyltransferase Ste14
MEWMPKLQLGWLNGWIPLGLVWLVELGLLALFPKEVVRRLFDRSGWSQRQRAFTVAGKLFSLSCMVVLVLSPLGLGTGLFIAGACVLALGIAMLGAAMIQFRNTPPDEPVTGGLYTVSRHPQIVALSVAFVGICLTVGSWLALILLLASRVLQHFSIVAEEEACVRKYGEPYRAYLARVPRYLGW